MLYTPAALELARLWPFFSSVGEDGFTPETAESTLVRVLSASVAMMETEYGKDDDGTLVTGLISLSRRRELDQDETISSWRDVKV